MSKPHLKRSGGYWNCISQDRTGYGVTPRSAWAQWHALRPDRPKPVEQYHLVWTEEQRESYSAWQELDIDHLLPQ